MRRLRDPDDVRKLAVRFGEVMRLTAALKQIEEMPFTMVNDSESLRHTIRTLQGIAHEARKREATSS